MPAVNHAIIYARVSTNDGSQDSMNQVSILREDAKKLGLKVVREFVDHASGKSGDRVEFKAMFEWMKVRSEGGKPGVTLMFWALDRLTREGTLKTLMYLETVTKGYRCNIFSHSETFLQGNDGMQDVLIALFSTLAKRERLRIGERTKAGLARVRREGSRSGKAIGRPRATLDVVQAQRMLDQGKTWRETANALGVPLTTLRTRIKGRTVKRVQWSEPTNGRLVDGVFERDEQGETVVRFEIPSGRPQCLVHRQWLDECAHGREQEVEDGE